MKFTQDLENNVAYLSFKEKIKPGEVDQIVTVYGWGGTGEIHLDFREDGALLGIEFLNPAKQLVAMQEDADDDSLPADYWETAQ